MGWSGDAPTVAQTANRDRGESETECWRASVRLAACAVATELERLFSSVAVELLSPSCPLTVFDVIISTEEVEFVCDTDTSGAAFGVVPSQGQDGEQKAIAYVGCASPESRQSYFTTTQRAVYAEVVHRRKKPVSHKLTQRLSCALCYACQQDLEAAKTNHNAI